MQYKDKLSAEVEGRSWGPSDTPRPAPYHEPTSSLRKPRATTSRTSNTASQSTSRSSTPSMNYNSNEASNANESQKSRNEDFFASMGSANDTRREDLPPSQGGKYAGFGSDASYHPTSSRALPSVDDFRDDPMSALGKGWGVFGAALRTASKTINEYVAASSFACSSTISRRVIANAFSPLIDSSLRTLGVQIRCSTHSRPRSRSSASIPVPFPIHVLRFKSFDSSDDRLPRRRLRSRFGSLFRIRDSEGARVQCG